MEQNLTTESLTKTLFYFSLPYLLSYFLQTLYGMADLFIVGQFYGVASTTAVSIGSQAMHMLTVLLVGLAMGATILIGRATGGGDRKQAALAIGNTVTLFLFLSAVLTIVLLFAVKPITAVLSTPAEAVADTASYLTVCFAGIPFITAYNIISSIFRGLGDSRSPMYFIAAACAANIALDYLFIGTMGLGAAGAALGTTAAQTISVFTALAVILKKKTGVPLSSRDFRPDKATMEGLLKIGIPVALQDGFIQISFIVITVFANRRGLDDAAAVGIVEKIIGVLFLIPSTMLSSVSALCAQNIGAGKHGRARLALRYAAFTAVLWGVAAVVVMQFFAEPFIGLFTEHTAVISAGSQYMRGYVWDCLLAGIHFCFSGYFCAYGLSGISFLHNFMSILCARIPLAYFASVYFTSTLLPMGLASTAGSMLSVLICAGAYMKLDKKNIINPVSN